MNTCRPFAEYNLGHMIVFPHQFLNIIKTDNAIFMFWIGTILKMSFDLVWHKIKK